MTTPGLRARAVFSALLVCGVALPLLSGCTLWNRMFHRGGSNPEACTEKPFKGNTESLPPLKVPEGLSAPDTRNAVKIPDLGPQARVIPKLQPCLALPPSFFSKTPAPGNRKPEVGKPAPTGTPASTPDLAPPSAAPAPPPPAAGEPVYPPGT